MSEALAVPGPPDGRDLLATLCRYVSHLDAVVFEQTRLNRFVTEEAYQPFGASNLLTRQSTNAVLITAVMVSCLTEPTKLLIGSTPVRFPAGVTSLAGLGYVLRGQVPIRLDTVSGAPAESTLIVMGQEFPISNYSSGGYGG